MTPLVLVVALGAFVHPHSSRDVRPAIVTRRVEPPPAAHPVREFVGRCVDPEVPARTSELTEAVIIIGLFLLQALFCPCCRMVLAMPGKVASTVASTALGRLRGGATDEALLHIFKRTLVWTSTYYVAFLGGTVLGGTFRGRLLNWKWLAKEYAVVSLLLGFFGFFASLAEK